MKKVADRLVAYAERDVERKRAAFFATLAELRHRVDPRVIASETADRTFARAEGLFDDAKITVKQRPLAAGGAGIALLSLIGLAWWRRRENTVETDVDDDETVETMVRFDSDPPLPSEAQ